MLLIVSGWIVMERKKVLFIGIACSHGIAGGATYLPPILPRGPLSATKWVKYGDLVEDGGLGLGSKCPLFGFLYLPTSHQSWLAGLLPHIHHLVHLMHLLLLLAFKKCIQKHIKQISFLRSSITLELLDLLLTLFEELYLLGS